eukprot:SAG22_NODE_803_length_7098_cov_2.856408_2_plen_57_part_00
MMCAKHTSIDAMIIGSIKHDNPYLGFDINLVHEVGMNSHVRARSCKLELVFLRFRL